MKRRTPTSPANSSVKPVLTKHDFVRRYEQGEFGNHSPTWDSLKEWEPHCRHDRLYHIRNRVAGGETWYDLLAGSVGDYWKRLAATYGEANLYISEMAPTPLTLFQGEVMESVNNLDLTYSTVRKPMRDALREETNYACGIIALSLLKLYLCPASYDWMTYLLQTYRDHVIEFSTYATNWGTLPHVNTVFWEVRQY